MAMPYLAVCGPAVRARAGDPIARVEECMIRPCRWVDPSPRVLTGQVRERLQRAVSGVGAVDRRRCGQPHVLRLLAAPFVQQDDRPILVYDWRWVGDVNVVPSIRVGAKQRCIEPTPRTLKRYGGRDPDPSTVVRSGGHVRFGVAGARRAVRVTFQAGLLRSHVKQSVGSVRKPVDGDSVHSPVVPLVQAWREGRVSEAVRTAGVESSEVDDLRVHAVVENAAVVAHPRGEQVVDSRGPIPLYDGRAAPRPKRVRVGHAPRLRHEVERRAHGAAPPCIALAGAVGAHAVVARAVKARAALEGSGGWWGRGQRGRAVVAGRPPHPGRQVVAAAAVDLRLRDRRPLCVGVRIAMPSVVGL